MEATALITALVFAVLAVGHSVLGDKGVIAPLIAADWTLDELPRGPGDRLLRAAWHLTSVAWIGFAAVALDADVMVTLGVAALVSAAVIGIAVPGHFAWPLFLLGGFAALSHADLLPRPLLITAALTGAAVLAAAGGLHVYWARGGRRLSADVFPRYGDGERADFPPPLATLTVAAALFVAAGLVAARALELGPRVIHWFVVAAVVAFCIRAVGDGRQVGFSKSDRSTAFARKDDRWFTPIVTFLAFGAAAALLV